MQKGPRFGVISIPISAPMFMEASVDPQPWGPDWMPITPKRGPFCMPIHSNYCGNHRNHWSVHLLPRGRRRRQKGVEPRLYDRVAFVRSLFQTGTIGDLDRPPAVADETGGLHRLRGKRHRFPVGTQHVSQEFVRVCQVLAPGAIMHHEEPAAQSLLQS